MKNEGGERIFAAIKLILSGLLLIISFTSIIGERAEFYLRLAAAVVSGYEIAVRSVKNVLKGEIFDENK